MGNLHNKSFKNLCGVADWLIISGLNAILPCAFSYDSYPNYAVARQDKQLTINPHKQWGQQTTALEQTIDKAIGGLYKFY